MRENRPPNVMIINCCGDDMQCTRKRGGCTCTGFISVGSSVAAPTNIHTSRYADDNRCFEVGAPRGRASRLLAD